VTVLGRIRDARVLPVIELPDPKLAVPLAETLRDVGIGCMEITFRAAGAAEAIAAVRAACPAMLIGAGTVLTLEQLDRAVQAGAEFVVSPGLSRPIVERAIEAGVVPLPGVATPTEIQMGLDAGLSTLKFFPAAAAGGVPYLKALAGPFRSVEFVPTGGIDAANLADYLALPGVAACGGSWFVKREWLAAGDWASVSRGASEAMEIARTVRG